MTNTGRNSQISVFGVRVPDGSLLCFKITNENLVSPRKISSKYTRDRDCYYLLSSFNYLDKTKNYKIAIKQSKGKLFVIDNADLLLDDIIGKYIAMTSTEIIEEKSYE